MLALLLTVAVGMQAQSLVGSWKTTEKVEGGVVDMYFVFGESTLTMNLKMTYPNAELGTIYMSVKLPGSYSRKGNLLNINMRKKDATIDIDRIEFNSMIDAVLKQQPELKKQLMEEMEKEMAKDKNNIISDFPDKETMKIKTLTDTRLVLDNGDEDKTFTKVAKK